MEGELTILLSEKGACSEAVICGMQCMQQIDYFCIIYTDSNTREKIHLVSNKNNNLNQGGIYICTFQLREEERRRRGGVKFVTHSQNPLTLEKISIKEVSIISKPRQISGRSQPPFSSPPHDDQ